MDYDSGGCEVLMKNGYGQEVRWLLEKDMLAHLKETQTPEKYAEIEARLKERREQIRERAEALRPKNTQATVRVRLESGQIVVDNAKKLIGPTEEDFCATAEQELSPEVLAWRKRPTGKSVSSTRRGTSLYRLPRIRRDALLVLPVHSAFLPCIHAC